MFWHITTMSPLRFIYTKFKATPPQLACLVRLSPFQQLAGLANVLLYIGGLVFGWW